MSMTHDQKRSLRRWVQERVPGLTCPACGKADYHVCPDVVVCHRVEVAADRPASLNARSGVPLVALTCTFCAHVLFFNAATIGLIPATTTSPDGPHASPCRQRGHAGSTTKFSSGGAPVNWKSRDQTTSRLLQRPVLVVGHFFTGEGRQLSPSVRSMKSTWLRCTAPCLYWIAMHPG